MPLLILAASALLTIAADAGLIPASRWQGDEYFGYWFNEMWGWRQLPLRILGPSPRPLAELLDYGYVRLVRASGDPLLVPVLAATWLAAAVPVVLVARRRRSGRDAVLLLALFAILLCLRKPSELLFWPVGAFAYLGGLSCLGAATMLLRRPLDRRDLRPLCALLLAAASFDEVAASIVAANGVLAAASLRAPDRAPDTRGRRAALLCTGIYGALICGGTFLHRMRSQGRLVHPGAGIFDVTRQRLPDAVRVFASILDNGPLSDTLSPSTLFGRGAVAGTILLLITVLGCAHLPARPRPDPRLAICWAGSLLFGCFLSVLLAFEQFGLYCCERHSAMQSGAVLLAAFVLAGLVSLPAPGSRTLLLAAAVLGGFVTSLGALHHDYALLPRIVAAREAAWNSLSAPGPSAEIRMLPRGRIVNYDALDAGRFVLPDRKEDEPPWDAVGILEAFGKRRLTVVMVPG